jgi:trimeric autotransporter adhesin
MKTDFALSRKSRNMGGVIAGMLMMASSVLSAQNIAPRIVEPVNDSARITLRGNISAAVRVATDTGRVPASTPMTNVRLGLKRSEIQQAALDQYLAELQQKSSPNYHKWLTPEQFGALYGPADSDIAAIVAWLESQGLRVESVPKGKTNIPFSGTAGQIEKAFGTPLHSFQLNGREFYANTSEPTIPAALRGVVSGVTHLNTLTPRPLSHRGTPATLDTRTGRFTPMSNNPPSPGAALHPDLSISQSGSNYLYVVAGDAATIYNTPNSFNANFSSGTSYTGSGVTIGIGGDATVSTTPLVNYRKAFVGGDTTAPILNYVGTGIGSGDADEAYLDMEISGGLAPGAKIVYYASADLFTGVQKALDDNTVDIFNLSFGVCELDLSTSDNQSISDMWQQAAVQGIAVTVSTGDNGSAGCDATTDNAGNPVPEAKGALAVNALASTPYNIAVGGTDYYNLEANFSTYATVPGSSGIAGSAATSYRTALKYIPESTWNDSTTNNTTVSQNKAWSVASNNQEIVAGSGGKSNCSTNTTIDTTTTYLVGTCAGGHGYSKPSWQRGTGVPNDGARDLPDISFLAGNGLYGAVWTVCDNYSPPPGTVTYDCSDVSGSANVDGFGGTSASAPAFAGMLALVQQSQGGGRLGQAAENLYNLYNNGSSSVFHDVTVGNISVPCTSGSTTDCVKNSQSFFFLSGYNTTAGYDLATGLGSADVTALITKWSSSLGSAAATVTVTPASSTVNVANSLDVTIAVSPNSPVPSGSVTLTSGTYTSAVTDLNNGSAIITIPRNSLAVGIDTLTATYSGDGTYSSATGTGTVTVDAAVLTPTTTTLTASNNSPTQGTSITLTATVAPAAATGTVKFLDGTTALSTQTLSSGTAAFSTTALAVGTHSITAVYSGDTSYSSSTSSAVTITVVAPITGTIAISLSPSTLTVSRGSTGNETLTLTPSNGYTGTVSFSVSTSNNAALTNLCIFAASGFDANGNLTVTGTAAVMGTVQIDTNASDCPSGAAVRAGAHGVRLIPRGKSAHASNHPKSNSPLPGGLAFAGLLLAGLLGRASRKLRGLACVIALAAVMFGLSACGSSSGGSSGGPPDPPKGTYTITIMGQDSVDSSISATSSFKLIIN